MQPPAQLVLTSECAGYDGSSRLFLYTALSYRRSFDRQYRAGGFEFRIRRIILSYFIMQNESARELSQ